MSNSMIVKVRLFGNWRDITGKSELIIQMPEKSTFLDLINMISEKYGSEFKSELIDENNKLLQPFSVSINYELMNPQEVTKRTLKDRDQIMFLFPVMGG